MDLADWKSVSSPGRVVLDGRYVRLEPLDHLLHGDGLFALARGEDADRLYRYLPEEVPTDRAEFDAWLLSSCASRDPLFFAVIDRHSGSVQGRQALMDMCPEHGSAEIGHILWGPRIARTRATTEAFFLLAEYVFSLGYRRWQWRCDAANIPSRRAAGRFGFTAEGVFRQHMIVKGKNRDTAWFSIVDEEWPALRDRYLAWLDPANFDEHGRERRKLRDR